MRQSNILRAFTVSRDHVRRVLQEHCKGQTTHTGPSFSLQLAKYRYSLRNEYVHLLGQYLNLPPDSIAISVGVTDTSQTKGVHKCVAVRLPANVPPQQIKALRSAIDSKRDRNFLELHIVGTCDAHEGAREDAVDEHTWTDAVRQAALKIQSVGMFVIVHHSPESRNDANYMRAVSQKFQHIPVVFDLLTDLPEILQKNDITIPETVPRSIAEKFGTSSPENPTEADDREVLFRKSLRDYFSPGGLWNSAYFMHNGVCLGCRKEFDYLFQTKQIERMLKAPNETMYSGLRYQRTKHFAKPRTLIGYKPRGPRSNVTSLQRPLG